MFTGRMWDEELGLYDYRARVYNPGMGVFYQTDPLGYHDSTNMYAYCINDPVNFVDPYGEYVSLIADWVDDKVNAIEEKLTTSSTTGNFIVFLAGDLIKGTADVLRFGEGMSDAVDACGAWDTTLALGSDFFRGISIIGSTGALIKKVSKGAKGIKKASKATKKLNSIGKPLELKRPGVQIGVDPHTIIPDKIMKTLNPRRLKDAEKHIRDHAIVVSSKGVIRQGHHRLANAIAKGRAVDVIVEAY